MSLLKLRHPKVAGGWGNSVFAVMPDERTVLMGDATNGGLFMFIADRARDLSSGTLNYRDRYGAAVGYLTGLPTLD